MKNESAKANGSHDADLAPLVLTIPQAATILRISRALAYDLARQGKIPVLRLGEKRLVVPKAALDKLLAGVGSGKSGDT